MHLILTLILGIVIWGGVTNWGFIGKSDNYIPKIIHQTAEKPPYNDIWDRLKHLESFLPNMKTTLDSLRLELENEKLKVKLNDKYIDTNR